MLEITSFSKPTPLLLEKDLTLFCSIVNSKLSILEKFLEPMSKFTSLSVGTDFIFQKVSAQFHFEFGPNLKIIDFGIITGRF